MQHVAQFYVARYVIWIVYMLNLRSKDEECLRQYSHSSQPNTVASSPKLQKRLLPSRMQLHMLFERAGRHRRFNCAIAADIHDEADHTNSDMQNPGVKPSVHALEDNICR